MMSGKKKCKSHKNVSERIRKENERNRRRDWDKNPIISPKERIALRKQERFENKQMLKIVSDAIKIRKEERKKPSTNFKNVITEKALSASTQLVQKPVATHPPQNGFIKKMSLKILSLITRRYSRQQETAC